MVESEFPRVLLRKSVPLCKAHNDLQLRDGGTAGGRGRIRGLGHRVWERPDPSPERLFETAEKL